MLKSWITDARFAARRLRNRPAYTLLAVLTLALGIGGSAAVFGVARPLLFDPLPYAHADEVGTLWMPGWWNEEEFLFLRGRIPGFRQVAAHRPGDVIMRDGEGPARLVGARQTSWELFDVLGARPLIGRGFREGDDAQGAEPVVVLSYGLWQELGGRPSVLGQRLTIDGAPRTVVGVMPRGFWFPDPSVRLWHARPLNPQGRNGSYALTGRVAPGLRVDALQPQLASLVKTIDERFDYSEAGDKTKAPAVTPLRQELLGSMRPALLATLTAMGLILLIACANVAALMLGQVEGRSSELAVRSALGANRRRLTQQLVVEALLVGVLAAVAGGALAAGGFRLLAGALPIGAWAESARFDWTMFVAALVLALAAVLLVVLVPSISLWRGDLRARMGSARTGGIQGRGGRLESALVVTEVALAMLIASGAALLVRSVSNLYAIDPGIRTEGLAVVDVMSNRSLGAAPRRQSLDEIARAMAALPGVRSVGVAMKLPLRGPGDSFGLSVEGRDEGGQGTNTYFRIVTPNYFETMGIRLRDGRLFDNSDRIFTEADSVDVVMSVVINEAMAKKHFPGENPIGRRLVGGFGAPQRIVGVVSDVAEAGLTDEDATVVYYLAGQAPIFGASASLVLRTADDASAEAVLDDARGAVTRAAPDFAVQGTTTMTRVLDTAVGPARQIMSLLALLSSLALVLGAVGIYGVIAHFAARRKRDWAIKVTLGLMPRRVIGSIVAQGATLVAAGVAVGLVGTAALARLLATFLFRVGTLDPIAFAAAGVALLVVGLAAALVPAWRAGMLNPSVILREQ
jgi:predicted permease